MANSVEIMQDSCALLLGHEISTLTSFDSRNLKVLVPSSSWFGWRASSSQDDATKNTKVVQAVKFMLDNMMESM